MSRARWLLMVPIVGVAVGSAAPAFALSDGDWVDGSVAFTVDSPVTTAPPPPEMSAPAEPPRSAVAVAEESGTGQHALPWWGLGPSVLAGAGVGLVSYRRPRSRR
jgi:hypothetical protein